LEKVAPKILVPPKKEVVEIVFEGFDNQEKIKLAEQVKSGLGLNTVNMPSKLNQGKNHIIVVSKHGEFDDRSLVSIKGIVNL
jgi:hypothetical protein